MAIASMSPNEENNCKNNNNHYFQKKKSNNWYKNIIFLFQKKFMTIEINDKLMKNS